MNRRARARARGLTMLEVLISVAVLALVATLIYGAFDGMSRSREGIGRISERYHQGRQAIARMSREIQTAFISLHLPPTQAQVVRLTAFVGKNSGSNDRLDFTSFSHLALNRNTHESDQNELGYFLARDPNQPNKYDLVRREARDIDLEPRKGGVVKVLAEDVLSLDFAYLDPMTGEWVEEWDTMQASGQANRLPMQVRIRMVLRGPTEDAPIKMETKVPLAIQTPLNFAASMPANGAGRTASPQGNVR